MSVDELLKCIKKSRLLNEKHFAHVQKSVAASKKPPTPDAITNQLVKQQLITEWQAKMLLQKQTGFLLGQYRLLMPIGKGGMGKVFKARDRKNKRVVAIKVLAKKLAKNKKLVARFQREIELATKLDSPYIVRTVDAGVIGESHFMVMEYVDGESIDAIANRNGRVSTGHACELARQAALGLQAAFEQGMVHRDIKPANLMVTFDDGQAKVRLLDMGLARLEDDQENDGMTRTGQVMGTPDYMAPEQGWDTASVDIRADIYGLGCTLFRLVTGNVPFPGDNPLQVLMARCSVDAPLASSIVPDIDPRVDAALRQMTWRDPDKRFQTPIEVAQALAALAIVPAKADLEGGTGSGSPVSQKTVVNESTQNEPSFQEFLRDMDSGAEVQLLDTTQPESFGSTVVAASPSSSAIAAPRNKSKLPLMLGGGLVAAIASVVTIALLTGNKPKPEPEEKAQEVAQPTPVVYFARISAQRAEPGQVVSFYATPEFTDGLEDIKYALGEGAPEGATLDAESGEFYWVPPSGQKPGRITVQLLAKREDEVAAECVVFIDILATALVAKIVEFENELVTVGKLWSYKLALFGQKTEDVDAEFKLVGNPPDGMKLDAKTGELTWTPTLGQIGRQPLSLQLVDPTTDRVVHAADCSLLVMPDVQQRVVNIPPRSIEAGKALSLNLAEAADTRLPPQTLWVLTTQGTGARVNRRSSEFTWTPPADARGETVFEFVLTNRRNTGAARFVVTVGGSTPTTTGSESTTGTKSAPPESEVADAEAKIRELFERDFGQRSINGKRELANKLLERSFDDNPPAMHYALLQLGLEKAKDCRAYATGAEIARLLGEQFGQDRTALTADLVDGFRSRGVPAVDKSILGEVMFREAMPAVKENRFRSTSSFMRVAKLIAQKGRFSDVVDEATAMLRSLPTDSDEPGDLDDKQQLAKDELLSLLRRYQFVDKFRTADSLRFIQTEGSDPVGARALWDIGGRRISMEAPQSPMVTGFIDPATNSDTFIIRMLVDSSSNSGMVMLAAPSSGRMFGYQVPLAGPDRLHVKQSNLPQSLARPTGRLTNNKRGWDLIEIAVSSKAIIVSMNGNPVTEATLSEPPQGSVGLVAVLKDAPAEHVLKVRNVRMLETPPE